jgi:hypothetical protein
MAHIKFNFSVAWFALLTSSRLAYDLELMQLRRKVAVNGGGCGGAEKVLVI